MLQVYLHSSHSGDSAATAAASFFSSLWIGRREAAAPGRGAQRGFYQQAVYRGFQKRSCHVAVVSTFPPKKCGVAEFAKNFTEALRRNRRFQGSCSLKVFALLDPRFSSAADLQFGADESDPHFQVLPVMLDSEVPSRTFWDCASYINREEFSIVILQQEFGLTPIMWQMVDLLRWIEARTRVYSVIHTPRAYPSLEEVGLLRLHAADMQAGGQILGENGGHELACKAFAGAGVRH
jgi:hypothetical protein